MGIQCVGKSAIDAVYDAHMEKVYQVARYYSGNHHTAQDITQSVFLKLYMNMGNINMDNVETWLKTTAKHMALNGRRDHARTYKNEELVADIENEVDTMVYLESLEDSFVEGLNAKARAELIEEIYAELYRHNERWYEAMTITYILQKPQKEVAEVMGIPLGALQMMLYRAKCWVKKRYQKQFDHLNET